VKKSILILIIAFSFISIKGQTYFDVDIGNDSSSNTIGGFIYEFPDTSGYLAVGAVPVTESRHLIFIRLDEIGDTIWTKMYGTPKLAKTNSNGKYVSEGDSAIIFPGTFFTDSITQSIDTTLAMLTKIDTAGNIIWERYYGDTTKKTIALDVQKSRNGGYIITGQTSGWGAGSDNSFLLKVDNLGAIEWVKTYVVPSSISDGAYSVDTTSNGGYIISGPVYYSSPSNQNDMFVLRTDSLGNVLWVTVYGSPFYDVGQAYLTKYDLNDYILAGGITVDFGSGLNSQFYLAKIDGLNGNIIWDDTTGIDQTITDETYSSNPIITSNGDIVVVGANTFNGEALIHRYGGMGNKLWERSFDKYGGNNFNTFWDIYESLDKGLIVTGDLTNLSIFEQRLWVVKLDSMGCPIINCSVGFEDDFISENNLLVYPNPTFGLVRIKSDLNVESIVIRDISGRMVKAINFDLDILNISDLSNGIYLLELKTNKGLVVKKILKQ
jgi:hypothetical protein